MRICTVRLLCSMKLFLQASALDLTQYVNLFIGTQGTVPGTSYNGGNVFPGASLPFGAVKVGIDTTEFNSSTDANAGYTPDGNVTAITLLHESGTGGAPTYGLVPQMPLTTLSGVNVLDNLTYMQPRVGDDIASVGYYKTKLHNGVTVELAASHHAGLMQYEFPQKTQRLILVDVSHYLPTQDDFPAAQYYSNGQISLSSGGTRYGGYGVYRGGWAEAPDHTVFFCGEFESKPSDTRLFQGLYTDPYWPNSTNVQPTFLEDASTVTGGRVGWNFANRIGAIFEFPADVSTLRSKVGVSWISEQRACSYLNEISGYDLNATADAAKLVWNQNVLSTINITDMSNKTRTEMFYSALYRAHLLPSNRTGESPNWTPTGPYLDDLFTTWDTFRCLTSLYTLIQPKLAEGLVMTLIDIWKHERFMPDGRSANYNGRVQGGSNADNVLADAYVKGLRGAINWTEGYQAMLTDAEVTPYNNLDIEDLSASTKEGRGALPDWLRYGYITPNYGRSISRTVEYAQNDFSVAQVAKGIAPHDFQKYLNRSAGWQKIWKHDVKSLNFSGFLAPVYGNGTVQEYDPLSCGSCEWTAIAYEALPWEYSWTVPFDMETLISFMGGQSEAERRLDTMFKPGLKTGSVGSGGTNGIGSTIFNPGNEPSFITPLLYNYMHAQYKSVLRSRQTVDTYYNIGPSGLPGNSDAGAIDSWMIWQMLGLYPVVTQPVYLLLSPWFDDISMRANNKTLRITAQELSDSSYFVQSVKVNGVAWNKSWVTHDDLVGGDGDTNTIEFILGSEVKMWDTGDLPPSPGHVTL